MIRCWLHALARKFLSGGSLRMTFHPTRRRSACLRLEALEDRTLTSTLDVEPPGPIPPAAQAAAASLPASEVAPSSLAPADKGGGLVADVRALVPPSPDPPSTSATPAP